MAKDNIIVNYGFLTSEVQAEVRRFLSSKDPQELHYLTETSANSIRNLSKVDCAQFSAKTGSGHLWFLISKKVKLSLDGIVHYLSYGGKNTLDGERIKLLTKCFVPDAPLYLDVAHFFRIMVLSSNLMFDSSNEKLCLAVMVERKKIQNWWTAQNIIKECAAYYNSNVLTVAKIEECLNRHSVKRAGKDIVPVTENNSGYAFYTRDDVIDKNGNFICHKYQLRLTELITYYNDTLKKLAKRH